MGSKSSKPKDNDGAASKKEQKQQLKQEKKRQKELAKAEARHAKTDGSSVRERVNQAEQRDKLASGTTSSKPAKQEKKKGGKKASGMTAQGGTAAPISQGKTKSPQLDKKSAVQPATKPSCDQKQSPEAILKGPHRKAPPPPADVAPLRLVHGLSDKSAVPQGAAHAGAKQDEGKREHVASGQSSTQHVPMTKTVIQVNLSATADKLKHTEELQKQQQQEEAEKLQRQQQQEEADKLQRQKQQEEADKLQRQQQQEEAEKLQREQQQEEKKNCQVQTEKERMAASEAQAQEAATLNQIKLEKAKSAASLINPGAYVTVEQYLAGAKNDAEYEELDTRAIEAAQWTDREICKLIDEIKQRGYKGSSGSYEITFGKLFEETGNIFEALSGICKTAKKYNVLAFGPDLLLQGRDDLVIITLLKNTHAGIEIKRRKTADLKAAPVGSRSFNGGSMQNANSKCHICQKTVYTMEYVGASDKTFHKNCFRCLQCNCILKGNDYATVDDKFYCINHYTQLFNANPHKLNGVVN